DNKNKNKQNKNQNNPNKNKSKQNQNDQGKMSKDNADQLLNAAIQQEKATKQKMQRNMSQPRTRNLNKNW
ncbi:MAG TPA: aerotolerance regulator BatC, partial [Prevotella sp.]|nr:aerotolerance regulator BatC [Prevotella sp.]